MRAAYIDPNDPSMIFVSSQPATPQSNSLSRDDYYRLGPQAAVASPTVQPAPEPRAPVIIPTATPIHEERPAPSSSSSPSVPDGWTVVSPSK
mmetsp:Transcript_48672/g.152803  ORF Transcript_48672/g.152803 Transcript_48672/m.152803 type:complete len:92 (-) Transcript_48672:409-684(-)